MGDERDRNIFGSRELRYQSIWLRRTFVARLAPFMGDATSMRYDERGKYTRNFEWSTHPEMREREYGASYQLLKMSKVWFQLFGQRWTTISSRFVYVYNILYIIGNVSLLAFQKFFFHYIIKKDSCREKELCRHLETANSTLFRMGNFSFISLVCLKI